MNTKIAKKSQKRSGGDSNASLELVTAPESIGRNFFALFVPFRLRQAYGATGFAAILFLRSLRSLAAILPMSYLSAFEGSALGLKPRSFVICHLLFVMCCNRPCLTIFSSTTNIRRSVGDRPLPASRSRGPSPSEVTAWWCLPLGSDRFTEPLRKTPLPSYGCGLCGKARISRELSRWQAMSYWRAGTRSD